MSKQWLNVTATKPLASLPYQKRPSTCLPCAQRKVKCDRELPCSACQKVRVTCTFERLERLPKKRKLNASQQELEDKIATYEQALQNAGIPLPKLNPNPQLRSVLAPDGSGKRYYEQTLLSEVPPSRSEPENQLDTTDPTPGGRANSGERRDTPDQFGNSCLAGSLCPLSFAKVSSYALDVHTLLHQIEVFFSSVNPLIAVLPVLQGLELLKKTARSFAVASAAPRAVLLAACACAVVSQIQDCDRSDDSRAGNEALLGYYHHNAWEELLKASLLRSSDPLVLQAFLLLLTSMQHDHDPVILWTLLGLAVRQAQRMGLHRDGTVLGLSPYETELRRRIWWYLITLDLRVTEVSGCARVIGRSDWDTRMPLNINDDSMTSDMNPMPQECVGFTDMTFCLIQYHITQAIRRHRDWLKSISESSTDLKTFQKSSAYSDTLGALTKAAELQDSIESKYLRFCDPIVPLHSFATSFARSMLCKFRVVSLMCTSEAGNMERFGCSLRIVQYDNLIRSTKSNHRFAWYAKNQFEGGVLLQLIKRLTVGASVLLGSAQASTGDPILSDGQLREAWLQLTDFFENNTSYTQPRDGFHLLVARKAIEAWNLEAQRRRTDTTSQHIRAPAFIDAMETAVSKSSLGSPLPSQKDRVDGQHLMGTSQLSSSISATELQVNQSNAPPQLRAVQSQEAFPLVGSGFEIDPWINWDETFETLDFSGHWP